MNATASSIPLQCQDWLQQLYSLQPLAPVNAFLVEGRAVNGPKETLLLREAEDALELGLYLDPVVVARMEARGGLNAFACQSLEDFWIVLEGVSHFVCLGWHAGQEREISVLDLELQAEIDKFVSAWEFARQCGLGDLGEELHRQLFEQWRHATMPDEVAERYVHSSHLAARYCRWLQVHRDDVHGLRAELREFFRLSPRRRRERISELHEPRRATR